MTVKKIKNAEEYVYDISLDGTFVNAVGMNVVSNTDGFNFKMPDKFRFTEENPYIGKGMNREVKEGKAYVGYEADVAEFNDLYMNKVYSEDGVQKMGLGIDEIVPATINFSRKNYADYFPENPYPKDVKLVGNTIKSKKIPTYIEKFLNVAVRLLLQGKGTKFIEEYYASIDKIYNYQIPIRDIATKGKVKKSIEQYNKDITEITKAGRPKSRQAWYELAIANNIKIDNGDTVYYVNTGKSKSHADVKKITHYYIFENGEKKEITKTIDKEYKKYQEENPNTKKKKAKWMIEVYPSLTTEDEIILNCQYIENDIINSDRELYCEEAGIEYNCPKYIDMFNKRITPLLVCFSKDIRNEIIITNPKDRKYFTDEQCIMVSGESNKPTDQDTYEQLMTMEDKEIRFWTKYNMTPPFLEECGMGKWEDIVSDYNIRMEDEEKNGIKMEKDLLEKAISEMTYDEYIALNEDGELPNYILKICYLNPLTMELISKTYKDTPIGKITDIIDNFTKKCELA